MKSCASSHELVLTARGLTKIFSDKTVLRSVDLDVARGETVVIIGASGSGKTTLLRCICHLEGPSAGVVDLEGQPIGRIKRPDGAIALQASASLRANAAASDSYSSGSICSRI
jgi:polar amino acid transport system ATP-binding protein